jgi:hydroxymethylpyrimidine/phosphomethylpyrimidine kinase
MNRTIMTIGPFDSSGATGIVADLSTFQTFRVYGAPVTTAIIAQNTSGIQGVFPIPMEFVGQQIEAVVSDMPIHAVKIGFLSSANNIEIITSLFGALNIKCPIMIDPVIINHEGQRLLNEEAVAALKSKLFPLAFAVTPNTQEAEVLTGIEIKDMNNAKEAAKVIFSMGVKNVIITGGHLQEIRALDLWYDGSHFHIFEAPRLSTKNTLGIGCTFSSIVISLIARGLGMGESIEKAKQYIAKAMQHPFQIGKGAGPLNHTIPM